jgi:hypothetical protein
MKWPAPIAVPDPECARRGATRDRRAPGPILDPRAAAADPECG